MANVESDIGYFPRAFLEISGLPPSQAEDALYVAEERAHYVIGRRLVGLPVKEYDGRNPGTINLLTESYITAMEKH